MFICIFDDTIVHIHHLALVMSEWACNYVFRCLADETSALLLYSLVHGNSDFLEYVLVRTDLDTLVKYDGLCYIFISD